MEGNGWGQQVPLSLKWTLLWTCHINSGGLLCEIQTFPQLKKKPQNFLGNWKNAVSNLLCSLILGRSLSLSSLRCLIYRILPPPDRALPGWPSMPGRHLSLSFFPKRSRWDLGENTDLLKCSCTYACASLTWVQWSGAQGKESEALPKQQSPKEHLPGKASTSGRDSVASQTCSK